MDGLKTRLNDSIQLKLSFALSLAILAVAVAAGIFSFQSAFDEAHELQDDVLRQVAQLMDPQHLSTTRPRARTQSRTSDEQARVIVQRLDADTGSSGELLAGKDLQIAAALPDGLHTLQIGAESYRVLIKTMPAGGRIAVAQSSGLRNEIARDGALRTVMPILILMPLLLMIASNLVRKMFLPIAVLSSEIDQRANEALHAIEDHHLPVEVRPFVVAINRLFARVEQSMDTQRRFVADAAHELRSPLTALSLQAERLANVELSGTARERLTVLRQGIERGRSLLDQLLTLARAQSGTPQPQCGVSVQGVYRRVLEDLMPLAEAGQIDIGVVNAQDANVWASEPDMHALIRNLVDNAIRYTPAGGRIDLSVSTQDARAVLRIADTGPGIPLAQRDRVFDPFYRMPGSEQTGSGLGLAIVKAIAHRVGAQLSLNFTDDHNKTGLCVEVILPAQPPINTSRTEPVH